MTRHLTSASPTAEQIEAIIMEHCYPFSDVGIGGAPQAAVAILATLRASGRLAPEISDEDDYPDIMEGSLRAFGVPEEIATGRLRIHLAYVIYDAIERFSVKAPAVEGDVVEAAVNAASEAVTWAPEDIVSVWREEMRTIVQAAYPIIATATEARIVAHLKTEAQRVGLLAASDVEHAMERMPR